jgi:phosphopantetheine--protein transferase-like protein
LIGIDSVYVPRMQKILEGINGDLFLDKILTDEEKQLFHMGDSGKKAEALSRIFAMKEAVIKASAIQLEINDLSRIHIESRDSGQLTASIAGEDEAFFISASLLGNYVIAVAISCR